VAADDDWHYETDYPLVHALRTLATNLRWAGALTEAFLLGHSRGLFRPSGNDEQHIIDAYQRDVWRPGSNKPAPGWG
jgi:hypothetical protein